MGAAPILTILRDGETVKTVPLDGEVVLGRAEACVIRFEDRAISRQHAVFRPTAEGVQVERKSEFAPLAVNGAECTRAIVKEGDVIAIGPYLMKLSVPKGYRLPETDPAPAGNSEATAPIPLSAPADAGAAPGRSSDSSAAAPAPALSVDAAPEASGDGSLPGAPGLEGSSPGADGALPGMGGELALGDAAGALPGADGFGGGGDNGLGALEGADGAPGGAGPSAALPEVHEPSAMISDDASTRVMSQHKLLARLDLPAGVANVTEFDLNLEEGQEIGIGRGKDCEIVLKDKKASRRNSVITLQGGRYVVRDLNSANGTWVNGEQVTEQALYSDDVIKVGSSELVFYAESADYPERERDFLKVPEADEAGGEDFGAGNFEGAAPDALAAGALPLEAVPGAPQALAGAAPGFGDPAQAGFAVDPNAGAVPGAGGDPAAMGAIPGILGVSGPGGAAGPKKKQSLYAKYKALPPKRRMIWTVVLLVIFYMAFIDDSDENPVAVAKRPKIAQKKKGVTGGSGAEAKKGPLDFDGLSDADKQFVMRQYDLAFDYYKNHEYDKAAFELGRIHAKLPELNYALVSELERYVNDAKRILEQNEAIARAKREEEKRKAEVAALLEETAARMRKRQYDQARELFGKILPLDPENQQVQAWRKEIENWEDDQRLKDQERQVRVAIDKQAWEILRDGIALQKKARYRSAIAVFAKIRELNPPDGSILRQANARIARCKAAIRALRDPVLAEAKQLEGAGEFAKAFGLYAKATKIDPEHPEGYAGMNRIRGILHDRAKILYTEAVLAESYSDFLTAKKKYGECLRVAPPDDLYHERAERKLARFIRAAGVGDDAGGGGGPGPASGGGGAPQ